MTEGRDNTWDTSFLRSAGEAALGRLVLPALALSCLVALPAAFDLCGQFLFSIELNHLNLQVGKKETVEVSILT